MAGGAKQRAGGATGYRAGAGPTKREEKLRDSAPPPLLSSLSLLSPSTMTFRLHVLSSVVLLIINLLPSSALTMFPRRILVTGANTGIGLALSKQLVKDHGCHVYLGSRNVEKGEKAVAEVKKEAGDSVELLNIVSSNARCTWFINDRFLSAIDADKKICTI